MRAAVGRRRWYRVRWGGPIFFVFVLLRCLLLCEGAAAAARGARGNGFLVYLNPLMAVTRFEGGGKGEGGRGLRPLVAVSAPFGRGRLAPPVGAGGAAAGGGCRPAGVVAFASKLGVAWGGVGRQGHLLYVAPVRHVPQPAATARRGAAARGRPPSAAACFCPAAGVGVGPHAQRWARPAQPSVFSVFL